MKNLDADFLQKFRRGEDVLGARVPPQSQDRWMFEEHERILPRAAFTRLHQAMLECQRPVIRHETQVAPRNNSI